MEWITISGGLGGIETALYAIAGALTVIAIIQAVRIIPEVAQIIATWKSRKKE